MAQAKRKAWAEQTPALFSPGCLEKKGVRKAGVCVASLARMHEVIENVRCVVTRGGLLQGCVFIFFDYLPLLLWC